MKWPSHPHPRLSPFDPLRRRLCAALPVMGTLGPGMWASLPGSAHADTDRPVPDTLTEAQALRALQGPGRVVVIRHALAPGTFDPPAFTLSDCATQRNLDERGRAQSQAIGAWFERRRLRPAAVRTSPWCRCIDTARLAFGDHRIWSALGSPVPLDAAQRSAAQAERRQALAALGQRSAAGFEVWVTHQFVIQALTGQTVTSGEALVIEAGTPGGPARVLARFQPAPA